MSTEQCFIWVETAVFESQNLPRAHSASFQIVKLLCGDVTQTDLISQLLLYMSTSFWWANILRQKPNWNSMRNKQRFGWQRFTRSQKSRTVFNLEILMCTDTEEPNTTLSRVRILIFVVHKTSTPWNYVFYPTREKIFGFGWEVITHFSRQLEESGEKRFNEYHIFWHPQI